ncbi:hypothetical protein ACHWUR_00310 [Klebsiella pneumoniae]
MLSHFDHKVRLDIVLRVSSLNTVQPSALKELNLILEKQFCRQFQRHPHYHGRGQAARRTS